MSDEAVVETDFAAAMQQLSAQASGRDQSRHDAQVTSALSQVISAVHALGQRIESLEESVLRKFESAHFEQIEEQIAQIRNSETVNQKLFDSLHQELISYRDNFVRESLQKPFIRDLLVLFDDLSRIAGQSETMAASEEAPGAQSQLRDNLANTLHFLVEILHRLEVTEVETKETIDRSLHRVIGVEPAESPEEDGRIVRRVKRGFLWREKVLRPEEVIVRRLP